jgi:Zn-dependent protease with chaperone function
LILSISTFSQEISYSIKGTVNKKLADPSGSIKIDEGKGVMILKLVNNPTYGICYVIDDGIIHGILIRASDITKITLNSPSDKAEVWQKIRIESGLDLYHFQNGYQYDLRKELEDESFETLQNFQKYYGFFEDEFLSDYLQTVLYKIHPITLGDGRPGNLNIKILKSSEPNAFCTPNGTIILTTGILSTIMSEDELYGIIAHEVAHFVLDHQVVNITREVQRQKRAEFWSGFATAVVAAAETYAVSKDVYYPAGTLTMTTAILSSSIANSINERLGAKYSIGQESEADNVAVMVLNFLKKDPKALSSALTRIKEYCFLNGNFVALSGAGTHPSLDERINKMGPVDPSQFKNKKYDQAISLINTYNAIEEYNLSHFETVMTLVNRNIDAGVGTEDDLILKAICLRTIYDTPEKNQEALNLIIKAKTLNVVPNDYTFKQEGITLLRQGKSNEAVTSFTNYLNKLESQTEKSDYVNDEIVWTRKMIFKSGSF